jgi:hypothetical protein
MIRRSRLSNRWLKVLFVAALCVVVTAMLWYGISTGDQPDLACHGQTGPLTTPRAVKCYVQTPEPETTP